MRTRRRRAVALAAVLLALPLGGRASADAAVWELLRGGGHVVMLRHGATDPGVGDPPGFRLDDCATQRNLNDTGRRDARRIGAAFRTRAIPVTGVLSSRWCRCLETARLAFGAAEPWAPLDSQFHDRSRAEEQGRAVRARAGERPRDGNLVMVTHGANIAAWTGVTVAQGEMVVLAPEGEGRFRVAGRIAPGELGPE